MYDFCWGFNTGGREEIEVPGAPADGGGPKHGLTSIYRSYLVKYRYIYQREISTGKPHIYICLLTNVFTWVDSTYYYKPTIVSTWIDPA